MGVFKRGDAWWIDYYFLGRRKREKIGTSKTLAETVLYKRKLAIAENKFLDIKKESKIKFEDFADEYFTLHSKVNKKSWKDADMGNIKCLKRFFGGRYLHEITPLLIEKFKIERSKEVMPATVNRALSCLRAIFNKAIKWGKFHDANPVSGVAFFKEPPGRVRFLEKEEIIKLLNNCNDYLKPVVIVALNTGMRRGEIYYLKWHDIDFKRDIIHLYQTKNGEKREVPMNEAVKAALIKVKKNPESPYVFHNDDGRPYYNLRKSFFTACKKAGIIDFRFHDLRHTFASQLVMSGVDLNTVRELLGHKSLEMTLRYSHLSQDHKKRAVDVLAKQMDTIWTPEPQKTLPAETNKDITILDTHSYNHSAHSSIG